MHGIDEAAALDGHGELDGVEVGVAPEAAAQMGAGIDRRAVLAAARTQEGQLSQTLFVRPVEFLQEQLPGDLICTAPFLFNGLG